MNFAFEIELYDEGDYGTLYTFRMDGEAQTEVEKFLDDPEVQDNPDFHALIRRIENGLDKHGFRPYWFRDEEGVWALSAPYPKAAREALNTPYPPALRLYCTRFYNLVLTGNGGVKRTRTFQEDPHL